MTNFFIVWPERRNVPASQIVSWYYDAVANKELDEKDTHCIGVFAMARALHQAGLITLST